MINGKGIKLLYGVIAGMLALAALLATASSAYAAEGGSSNYLPGFYGDFGVAVAPVESQDFLRMSAIVLIIIIVLMMIPVKVCQ